MSPYDQVATVTSGEGCGSSLTTFHGRGTVLRASHANAEILAFIGAGTVEIWPSPGDPNGMPISWTTYDPQQASGAAEACELIRAVLRGR